MLITKKTHDVIKGKLEEAESEIRFLSDWKLKAEMKFNVIEKWIKASESGKVGKKRILEAIKGLLNE